MAALTQTPQRGAGRRPTGQPLGQPVGTTYTGPTMPSPTYIEMEARLDTVEARTDTKIERLGGKIDTMISTFNLKMEGIASALSESKQETRESARVTVVTTV